MFGWEYPPKHCGGLGIACQGLVRGLRNHGAQITLVLPHDEAETDGDIEVRSPSASQMKIVQSREWVHAYDTFEEYQHRMEATHKNKKNLQLYGSDLGDAVQTFTELSVEMSQDVDTEVVHSHDWLTFGAGARAAAYHHVPFVAHVHATELDRTHFRPNTWICNEERRGLAQADHIIAVSNYTKNLIVKEYDIHPSKIDVVHNGIQDKPQQAITSTTQRHYCPLVLFVGRLTVQKGPFHFLEAASIVHQYQPDVQFVIVGDGYLLSELMSRACQLGLHNHVIFAGKMNSTEVRSLYKKASCFVMPSTSEPFGLVALEAVAHHVPVILSRQSGVSEVVSNAFHIDFWDVAKLADCITTVLRDDALSGQMVREAAHGLHHLTWEHQASKVVSVYNNALT